ncbi:hypothetical protein EDD11_007175 [Mortierella claussenii]|nr:hypothetical protein EDD11_007175 [Mortierella claussenii]
MTSTTATSSLDSTASCISHTSPTLRPVTPAPSDPLIGRHLIYRGLTKSSMEYMSLAHSNKQPEAAHTLKGEILISGRNHPGYVQYCITLDQEWMTRRVMLTAMFDGSQEKRVILEVDQDQRWYKVTEHRLARSRSFFRSGVNSPAGTTSTAASSPQPLGHASNRDRSTADRKDGCSGRVSSESLSSVMSMQDVDASFSDAGSCCSASYCSEDEVAGPIPFEKIDLTWTPPAKGSKRGSKRFSSFNPLKDMLPMTSTGAAVSSLSPTATVTATSPSSPAFSLSTPFAATRPYSKPCATTPLPSLPATAQCMPATTSPTSDSPPPPPARPAITALRSPVVEFASRNRTLSKSTSPTSLHDGAMKSLEHLPQLDGCIHLDLGGEMSPSTLLLPLRRATLGIDPDEMKEHLASLMSCPSAVTSELTAMVSFPDLELRAVRTHVAYVGQGRNETLSIVECWTDEDDDDSDSTLVEVDEDGLVVRYGDAWARLPTC